MRKKMNNDERLCNSIIPQDFAIGCRRATPGNGYLEALVNSKTTCFTETIGYITPKGFKDAQGTEYEVDVIICATGFDTSWVPRFPIVVNGRNLQDVWAEKGVTSYLGVGVPDIPNYFLFCGPYGPLAHGSFFPIIEKYTDYILKVIAKMQVECIQSLRPRRKMLINLWSTHHDSCNARHGQIPALHGSKAEVSMERLLFTLVVEFHL
jgi:cation diffusion facilitator CzcD-associated flavoprotein CzcO